MCAMEPKSTPRSAGSLPVSAAVETELSTVSHALLSNQVPPLATFSGKDRNGVTLLIGMSSWS